MPRKQTTWQGPYTLTLHMVEKLVDRDSPGMYAVGFPAKDQGFLMESAGSSADIQGLLKSLLGKYQLFMFDSYSPPAEYAAGAPAIFRHGAARGRLKAER